MNETSTVKFWNSIPGNIIRWLSFIPLGMTLLFIMEIISFIVSMWLFRDIRGFVIIGLVFGAFFTMAMFGCMFYYMAYGLIIQIAPNIKIGSIIFATAYVIFSISQIAGFFIRMEKGQLIAICVIVKLIYMCVFMWGTYMVYKDSGKLHR